MRAEPGFEVFVGGLPVAPNDRGFFDGATFGAVVVNIEWLEDEFDFARGFFEII